MTSDDFEKFWSKEMDSNCRVGRLEGGFIVCLFVIVSFLNKSGTITFGVFTK